MVHVRGRVCREESMAVCVHVDMNTRMHILPEIPHTGYQPEALAPEKASSGGLNIGIGARSCTKSYPCAYLPVLL